MVIAGESRNGIPVNLGYVSEQASISRRYLEQVAISLKNGGLLKAVSGKKGGHLLTRPADEITLDEIVEATIGPINIVDCLSDPESCMLEKDCECRSLYMLINKQIKKAFHNYTLADLVDHKVGKGARKELASV